MEVDNIRDDRERKKSGPMNNHINNEAIIIDEEEKFDSTIQRNSGSLDATAHRKNISAIITTGLKGVVDQLKDNMVVTMSTLKKGNQELSYKVDETNKKIVQLQSSMNKPATRKRMGCHGNQQNKKRNRASGKFAHYYSTHW